MDSFGFSASAKPCAGGARRYGKAKNYPVWISVPESELGKFRYRELFRTKGGKIVVQDVLGYRRPLKSICKDFLLHSDPPE